MAKDIVIEYGDGWEEYMKDEGFGEFKDLLAKNQNKLGKAAGKGGSKGKTKSKSGATSE